MGNNIEIVRLSRNPQPVLRFLKVSYHIYRDDPYWVAPLLADLKKVFTDKNPLFEHADRLQSELRRRHYGGLAGQPLGQATTRDR